MKKLFTILAFFTSVTLLANDTIAIPVIDTVIIPKGAVKINPIVINVTGDTAYCFSWKAININSDTTEVGSIQITMYGRKANALGTIEQRISPALTRRFYGAFSFIEAFVLVKNPRLTKFNNQ